MKCWGVFWCLIGLSQASNCRLRLEKGEPLIMDSNEINVELVSCNGSIRSDLLSNSKSVQSFTLSYSIVNAIQENSLCSRYVAIVFNYKLPIFSQTIFGNCSEMEKLVLKSNKHFEFNDDFLHGLAGLKHLEITEQKFDSLDRRHLEKLTTLNTLEITKCGLKSIEKNAFDGTPNLNHLVLHSNDLNRIDGTIKGLDNLLTVNFNNNHIENFPWSDLKGLDNLMGLSLLGNNITTVDYGKIMKFTPKLKGLDLRSTAIGCKLLSEISEHLNKFEHNVIAVLGNKC